MNVIYSFVAVLALALIGYIGGTISGLQFILTVVIPYIALVLFIGGVVYRIYHWAKSPVPFRIPTTCGQQKSLHWIKGNNLENPHNLLGVIGRMLLEVLFFRSLFRNTKMELVEGPKLVYGSSKWLWLGGLVFHWSMLVIVTRHLRLFTEPVPEFVLWLQYLDGILQFGVPLVYLTSVFFLLALTYLFIRRVVIPQVRYISLLNDYFPLFLLIGIGLTGILMRHFFKTDIVGVKEVALGLIGFTFESPPATVSGLFYIHFFLVIVLFAYFPYSKLMHMPGVFMSPTRNMANTNRAIRYENPWNHPVKVHTYEEYEDDFRERMVQVGLPVDKPLEKKEEEAGAAEDKKE